MQGKSSRNRYELRQGNRRRANKGTANRRQQSIATVCSSRARYVNDFRGKLFFQPSTVILLLLVFLLTVRGTAYADRILLAPDGTTIGPVNFKTEFLLTPNRNLSWLQLSNKQGVEFEAQLSDIAARYRTVYAFNVQYPLLSEFGALPAVSAGVRDLLGTGNEHRSFYAAASRTLPLSDRQLRLFREVRLSAGFGTERMNGLFIGVHARLTLGATLDAEWYRQHANISLSLPLTRHVQVRASSLDGTIYYGLAFRLSQ